jgi:uncharacterized protein HemX
MDPFGLSTMRKLLYVFAVVVGVMLIAYAATALHDWWKTKQFNKQMQALELKLTTANEAAREAEIKANAAALVIREKEAELAEIQQRAEQSETQLQNTRKQIAPLKEAYEKIRRNPITVPADPVAIEDVCAKLAGIGYSCE